jgi:hypothetical protein
MKEEWKRELRSFFIGSKSKTGEEIAQDLSKTLRKKYGGAWQCVAGISCGSCVSYDEGSDGPLVMNCTFCARLVLDLTSTLTVTEVIQSSFSELPILSSGSRVSVPIKRSF